MSDADNINTLEPTSLIGALDKIIKGDWELAVNQRTGALVGTFKALRKISERASKFSYDDEDLGFLPFLESRSCEPCFYLSISSSQIKVWVQKTIK